MQGNIYDTTFISHAHGHHADDEATEWANGIDFTEIESSFQDIHYARFVGLTSLGDIMVYYDYAGDYYFFMNTYGE